MISIVILFLSLFILLGVALIPPAGMSGIVVPIQLINGDIIWGQYHIVDDLEPFCKNATNQTIGCAKIKSGNMYILEDYMHHIDEVYPIDIFTHEYLHIRCEYNDLSHNWHVGNGYDNQKIYPNIDYWNTCGY